MTKNCKNSLFGQIAYMAGTGAGFLFMPGFVTSTLHLGPSEVVWIRVVGALALLLCSYYYAAIQNEALWFARASVWGRYGFVLALVVLAYVFGLPMLAGVGVVEGLLVIWTQVSLSQK